MEVIAVVIAALSCGLVGVNTLFSSKSSASRQARRSRTPEEDLGKAAKEYLEQRKSLKLPGAEMNLGRVLAEYLSEHEQEIEKDYIRQHRR